MFTRRDLRRKAKTLPLRFDGWMCSFVGACVQRDSSSRRYDNSALCAVGVAESAHKPLPVGETG